jgi:aminoglycoside phosphotransferase (APT) family kinase protein
MILQKAPAGDPAVDYPLGRVNPETLGVTLEEFLGAETGATVQVTRAWRMVGGASRECWGVDLEVDGGPQRGHHELVLRRDLGGKIHQSSLSRNEEFKVLQAAYSHGVKAPRPRWLCADPEVLGGPFFLMDRLPGEALGKKVVRSAEYFEARIVLPSQMARELATIHGIPLSAELGSLPGPAPGESPAQKALSDALATLRDARDPHPALELAARWLREHEPRTEGPVLTHGDFRVGNLLVGTEGLLGVLDWEFAHVGDALEDLAWPCVRAWRFGRDDKRLGGISDADVFFDTYEAVTGKSIDLAAVAYWEVMGNFRWAVACLAQAGRHLRGDERSVELAVLGRKAAEAEWELMERICTFDRQPKS